MASVVSESKRPSAVARIAGLRVFAGVAAIGLAIYLATSTSGYLAFMGESISDYGSQVEVASAAESVGLIFAIQGVAGVAVAIGLIAGKKWAWTANVILSIILIALASSDIALGAPRSAIGLVFNAFILVYTLSKPVRSFFGRTGSSEASNSSGPATPSPSTPANTL